MSKEVGEEERDARGGVDRRSENTTPVDVEIDPHRRRLGRRQTDFALQAIVKCQRLLFGLWRVCFPPILIRTDRRLLGRPLAFGGCFPPVLIRPDRRLLV